MHLHYKTTHSTKSANAKPAHHQECCGIHWPHFSWRLPTNPSYDLLMISCAYPADCRLQHAMKTHGISKQRKNYRKWISQDPCWTPPRLLAETTSQNDVFEISLVKKNPWFILWKFEGFRENTDTPSNFYKHAIDLTVLYKKPFFHPSNPIQVRPRLTASPFLDWNIVGPNDSSQCIATQKAVVPVISIHVFNAPLYNAFNNQTSETWKWQNIFSGHDLAMSSEKNIFVFQSTDSNMPWISMNWHGERSSKRTSPIHARTIHYDINQGPSWAPRLWA